MPVKQTLPRIPLPRNWHRHVKSAVLHTISLSHFSIVQARGMAAGHIRRHVRLAAQNERLREECSLLREEIRIKDARMDFITPVHGELVILAENQAFFSLHRMTNPNLPRHGESIRCFRPHPVYDCQTAQTRRRESSRLRESPPETAASHHKQVPASGAQSHAS